MSPQLHFIDERGNPRTGSRYPHLGLLNRRIEFPNAMGITMYGTGWCNDCKRAKQFFGDNRIAYDYIDVDLDPVGMAFITDVNGRTQSIPVIRFDDGSALIEPSNAELAAKLGIVTSDAHDFHGLTIIGSGPAGLTAALYAAREGIATLVIERAAIGGQAAITECLDNYPGFPEGVSGEEFAMRLRKQAERFGVEIIQAQNVLSVEVEGDYRIVHTDDGREYQSHAVLIASGSTYRRLDIPGEEKFIGSGVHFCATCDGPFYRDQNVLVIGGGNSAAEESLFLSRFASHVTIAVRGAKLRASQVIVDKVEEDPKIEVLPNVTATAFTGTNRLESVVLQNSATGEEVVLNPSGVFVFIGLTPNTEIVSGLVELDEFGFIVTDGKLQTSVDGIFAAGDCRQGSTKQAASAAGEGATAALSIRQYMEPRAANRTAEVSAADYASNAAD